MDSDAELLDRFRTLADGHLEVLAGDIGEPNFGLDDATWQRLAETVDLIVHPAAHVNHVLPYRQLFAPNVAGTAEVVRLAITRQTQADPLHLHDGRQCAWRTSSSTRTPISAARCPPASSTTAMPMVTGSASGPARC